MWLRISSSWLSMNTVCLGKLWTAWCHDWETLQIAICFQIRIWWTSVTTTDSERMISVVAHAYGQTASECVVRRHLVKNNSRVIRYTWSTINFCNFMLLFSYAAENALWAPDWMWNRCALKEIGIFFFSLALSRSSATIWDNTNGAIVRQFLSALGRSNPQGHRRWPNWRAFVFHAQHFRNVFLQSGALWCVLFSLFRTTEARCDCRSYRHCARWENGSALVTADCWRFGTPTFGAPGIHHRNLYRTFSSV